MKVTKTKIPDVLLIEPKVYEDDRGFFFEVYQMEKMVSAGIDEQFVQDNYSFSKQHTLRGLHYQITNPQGKLIWVALGKVFDVAVDIRKSSPTFGEWVGIKLSSENKNILWIPQGFAHGFYVLSNIAKVIYKTTDYYFPNGERTIIWNDPEIGIEWPNLSEELPNLSLKDRKGKLLKDSELFE